jgi:two-component system, OmpR family, KDP operon response regulator KdpE
MTTAHGKILLVDDDPKLRLALHRTLQMLGFDITEASNGEQALRESHNQRFDAVLLDMNMPGMGGIETCRALRRSAPRLQILMLTVRDSEADKVQALDAGADDYVTKPFSIPELAARLRAAVRRATAGLPETPKTIVIGDIAIDPARRMVHKAHEVVHMTPKEFDLLYYLMSHAGLPITHAKLLQAIWGAEYGRELKYLRTYVHNLRQKLEDNPASPQYILTEAYIGYRFREPEVGSPAEELSQSST